jgi:hypothetical protein
MDKLLNTNELQELCKQYIDEKQEQPNEHSIINQFTVMDFVLWVKEKNISFVKKEEVTFSDPDNILQHKAMDMYAKKGHKVSVTEKTINWGYNHDKEQANKFLEVGKIYTVKTTWVYDWDSKVELEEISNERFNTVHFVDYKG